MSDTLKLAVDPSSPDAHVEDRFFQQGVDQEAHPKEDGPFDDAYGRRQRTLRWTLAGTLGALSIAAIIVQIASSSEDAAVTPAAAPVATVAANPGNPVPTAATPPANPTPTAAVPPANPVAAAAMPLGNLAATAAVPPANPTAAAAVPPANPVATAAVPPANPVATAAVPPANPVATAAVPPGNSVATAAVPSANLVATAAPKSAVPPPAPAVSAATASAPALQPAVANAIAVPAAQTAPVVRAVAASPAPPPAAVTASGISAPAAPSAIIATHLPAAPGPTTPGPTSASLLAPDTAAVAQPRLGAIAGTLTATTATPALTTQAMLEQSCRNAFDRKKYKDVIDSCSRAFEAKPQAAQLASYVAEVEFNRGRPAQALTWAQKAASADPNLADAYVFIGGSEQQAGHNQAAKTAYLKYLELAPNGRFASDLRAVVRGL